MQWIAAVRASRRMPWLQVAKSAIATMAAWLLAIWLIPEGPPPVFASIAALLVVQPSLNQSFLKAIERSAGVVVGVVVASLLAAFFGTATWVLLVAIAAALGAAWALKMTPGTTNQVGISALLVMALGAATPHYAVERVVETLIGAAVGFIINLTLVPPVAITPAQRAMDDLGEELAATLERLADALTRRHTHAELEELLLHARLLRPMREAADTAITAANESLTLNPRGRRHRDTLAGLRTLLARFDSITTQTIGMTRAYYDHYDDAIADDPAVIAIAEQLRRAAHDLRLSQRRAVPAAPATETVPALTTPLSVAAPTGDHWILIGSLMEDLRRIHTELTEDD